MTALRCAGFVLALFCPFSIFAQSAAQPPSVVLTVQATDGKGATVKGLTANEFELSENKLSQAVLTAREVTAAQERVSVFIVVDTVNIDFSRVAYVREEVGKFFSANGGKLAHPSALVVVSDKDTQLQPGFTTDGAQLAAALKAYPFGIRDIRRNTGVWGADERAQISLNALNRLVAHAATLPGRKLILWVSPGWPLLSGPRIELTTKQHEQIFNDIVSLSTAMRTGNITLDNINPLGPGESVAISTYYESYLKGISKALDAEFADLSLQVLAVQSGGRAFTNDSDVAGNLERSASDADDWYELTFPAAKGEKPVYHNIELKTDRPNVVLRTRAGYYTTP